MGIVALLCTYGCADEAGRAPVLGQEDTVPAADHPESVTQLGGEQPLGESPALGTRFVLLNESAEARWHGGHDGCSDDWLEVRPAVPTPASSEIARRWQEISSELGCVCDCSELGASEVCSPSACSEQLSCTAAFWSGLLTAGERLEVDRAMAESILDTRRKCFTRVGYPEGTEFVATFCWWSAAPWQSEAQALRTCQEQTFIYGEPLVTHVISD